MPSFTITANTTEINLQLAQLSQRVGDLQPAYEDIGESLTILIDTFFKTGIGADGQPWQANAFSTTQNYIKARGGYTANGKLNKRGQVLAGSKKVLQGITGELRRTIFYQALNDSLIVGSPSMYAAIQNFGGAFKAWGKSTQQMPARPFMPVDQNGNLYPKARTIILRRLQTHLQTSLK